MKTDPLKDKDVAAYLQGRDTVRDGRLASLLVEHDEYDQPIITLVFEKHLRIVTLKLQGVRAFNFGYDVEYAYDLGMFKCIWTTENEFYLSLDPYDEREPPSDADSDFFRATSVEMTVDYRPA